MSIILKLSSDVIQIPRVGPAKAKYLEKIGVKYARDFLFTFPRRYDDFSQTTPISELRAGEVATVRGRVKSVKQDYGFRGRKRLLRIFVVIEDKTGVIAVTWFNLRFLPRQLWQGRELAIAGRVEENSVQQKLVDGGRQYPKLRMRSPVMEFMDRDKEGTHTGRITPVYPETYGVTSRFLRYQVKNLLPLIKAIPEYIPEDIRKRQKLVGIHEAIKEVHFPESSAKLKVALKRLRFDELFFLQLAAQVRKRDRKQEKAVRTLVSKQKLEKLISELPFELTGAQRRAVNEIVADLSRTNPMNRLLQGDVGSGKSAVALVATRVVISSAKKTLYLAPTEILARQQAESFAKSIRGKKVELLIGATKEREKKRIRERLLRTGSLCVVGTHALLQDKVQVEGLVLVIVDEQHRFGVKQRKALQERRRGKMPHLLSMTATPIPRTLNLTIFGDLDVSVLKEMPPGRKLVKTKIIGATERDRAVTHVLEELHAGRQGYVIAPLVEQSEILQAKSAKETLTEMRKYFPGIAIELMHGKMSSDEKKTVMNNFSAGAIQLLVATSVVEVGVDVPNATIMIIEGAERFGLAQLHQFRGRIGRGDKQSYCYLFPTSDEFVANARLEALAGTNDGFIIAEEDLKLRGPGEMYGIDQSGFGSLQVASLLDYAMIKRTSEEAKMLLAEDPQLETYPILQKKVEQKNLVAHFE